MRALTSAATVAIVALLGWPATAAAQSACQSLGGTVDIDQMCRVHDDTASYTLDFSFPVDYPDQAALTDYLTSTRAGFVNVSDMPGSRDLPYVLDARATEYRSGTASHETRSVVFEVYQNVGGAHPQTWYKSFSYDIGARRPISYDTLFKPGIDPLGVVFPIVQSEIARQTGINAPISPADGHDPAKYQNFALTDDTVIFYFGQGELLPEAAGAVQAAVPRNALAPMLST